MVQAGIQLASIAEQKPLSQAQQQPEVNISIPAQAPPKPLQDLLNGSRKDYIEIAIPLYEASIKGDWKTAKEILEKRPELVRYSITENNETALHVAASAESTKQVEEFVENLMKYMRKEDLELQNGIEADGNTALCLAAAAGNVKMVKMMVEKNKASVAIIGKSAMTPLYMAALFGHYEVARYLYDNSKKLGDDCWVPKTRGWLLERCVENDMFDIALEIVKDHPEFDSSESVLRVLARKTDIFTETETGVVTRTIDWVRRRIRPKAGPSEKETKVDAMKLLKIIWTNIAEKPRKEIDKLIRGKPDPIIKQDDRPATSKEDQTVQLLRQISENTSNKGPVVVATGTSRGKPVDPIKQDDKLNLDSNKGIKTVQLPPTTANNKAVQTVQLPPQVTETAAKGPLIAGTSNSNVSQKHHDSSTTGEATKTKGHSRPKYSSRIIFVAAELGNTRFVVELIRLYPDLIWKVNDNNQTIFHIAVKHRHEGIYNLLYEIGSMKDMITPLIDDENENNMLHLVGKSAKKKRLADVSGVALQMQRELLWFKEVEKMIAPSYRERKNKDGLTPHELFTKEHKDLVKQGEDWMKNTASQCMVVATLIATIVFAAAFTVPGGYNQDNGIPFFYRKLTFTVFVVADSISLFASSASILMFLSILTSRYAERDFLESLPKKLMLGLATLFLSITTMMIAFSASFFVLYHKDLKWIPILITLFATMPVLLFATLQYPLLYDVIRSTYGSRYLFRPKKHVLYTENSKSSFHRFPFTMPFISTCTSKIFKLQ